MNYSASVIIMMLGLYIIIVNKNLLKKLIGLSLFQNSVLLLYISSGFIRSSIAPILTGVKNELYTSPVPHVLMLTAIVVGIATLSIGLAILINIKKEFNTIDIVVNDYSSTSSS